MGKVYVVGIGPGAKDQMTVRAAKVLSECQVIVGYTVYIDLIKEEYPDKICLSTPMRQEVQRCRMALEEAGKEQNVAVICSGDAGIYGMAGLVYELAADYSGVEIEVVPGITAASGGAAILGAPLMHDFAVISLSDLMTPWEKIEKRLRMAAMADFVICIYNPSSRKRADYLKKACLCMMEYKKEDTVCGIVKNIGREGECMKILSLKELSETDVDMFTTVFVGNEETRIIGDKMVTPRGYKNV
ncbi:MAG: precorrin-3B C(17)-methyltransferase [bacterium]|nr:precorrin-3B C(17)-methyltransferase [bacterium]MDY5458052.1 precorrin-3B C(17)-methyltransferase [Bariatricus sp.]